MEAVGRGEKIAFNNARERGAGVGWLRQKRNPNRCFMAACLLWMKSSDFVAGRAAIIFVFYASAVGG